MATACGFRNVYRSRTVPPDGIKKAWYGVVYRATQRLSTNHFCTAEEAARAVDRCGLSVLAHRRQPAVALLSGAHTHARARVARRFIYKLRGPEACNFPVTPELAAELDALTVEQVHEQFKLRR